MCTKFGYLMRENPHDRTRPRSDDNYEFLACLKFIRKKYHEREKVNKGFVCPSPFHPIGISGYEVKVITC